MLSKVLTLKPCEKRDTVPTNSSRSTPSKRGEEAHLELGKWHTLDAKVYFPMKVTTLSNVTNKSLG